MVDSSIPPPVLIEQDDDYDDMADLFSFGPGDGLDGSAASVTLISSDVTNNASTSIPLPRKRNDSPDSFIEMLEAETSNIVVISDGTTVHDQETQDILRWLDEDDTTEEIVFQSSLVPPEPIPEPTVVALPPSFDSFHEAFQSKEATKEQIRSLFVKEQNKSDESILDMAQRRELYCRMICNKTQEATMNSSLIDSFEKTRESRNEIFDDVTERILDQIATDFSSVDRKDLSDLVAFQRQQGSGDEADSLVPTVAAVVLSTGLPAAAAAVVISQLVPSFMPLLALPASERWDAAMSLHSEFYLLACYHLPMVVVHLDRYLPGWHWPKVQQEEYADEAAVAGARNLTKHGQVPPSWLVAQFATLPSVLSLWDRILTSQTNSARFFLTLAVLERAAPRLLLLTGDELLNALQRAWSLEDMDIEKTDVDKAWKFVWWKKAKLLEDATPDSALARLQTAEDTAVQEALKVGQERKEAAMQARLDAEAAAHREAQEKKAEEARQRLSRARLVAFYRKHAPSKESNVEKIMETYAGSLDVLDAKLRSKYGEGFNPALKPKPVAAKPQHGLLQGFGRKRSDAGVIDDLVQRKSDKVSLLVTAEEVLPVICWSKEEARAERRKNNTNRRPLKYFLVDSRSEEAAAEQGRFPTAVQLSPEAMMDPERLKQNAEMFESLRAAVHIVIMGEGFNAIPRLYNQKLSPKLTEMMEQDESRTNLCALFFQKRGFCFVSVMDGGFCSAHSWLAREGPSKHLMVSSVLVDYNPESSLFGQLETLHGASATEKAQRKMANLLESSMTTMTKRAQQLERIAMDLEEGRRQGGLRIGFFNLSEPKLEPELEKSDVKADVAGEVPAPSTNGGMTSAENGSAQQTKEQAIGFGKLLQQGSAAINKTQKRWGQSGGFGGFQQFRMAAVSRVLQTKDATSLTDNEGSASEGKDKPIIQKV